MTDDPDQKADKKPEAPEPAVPLVPSPPVLPTPAEAAMNAAIIVSEMVDIDSESGAVIAAAAAAGAAIEAATAAKKAADAEAASSRPNLAAMTEVPAGDPTTTDPITTVKLSRERIVAALDAEAAEAGGPRHPRARTEPGPRERARSAPGETVPPANVDESAQMPAPEQPFEDFDPVAVAAAAITRLRMRAKTDLGQLRLQYQRHDGVVLLLALVIIIIAGRVHASLVTPPVMTFSEHGLTFEHSTAWFNPEPTALPSPRLLREPEGGAPPGIPDGKHGAYHVELASSIDARAKIEVMIDELPKWSNNVMWLELDRRTRWGELYRMDSSEVRSIDGHDWLRTAYRYAHADEQGDEPRVDHAIEWATTDRTQIYVVTLFGTPAELERIEEVVEPSLRTESATGMSIVPQTTRLETRTYPKGVERAFDSTVMVIVADLVDGKLRARGGGSGVIAGRDGSILTNYHVLEDVTEKQPRLHDLFIIARFADQDRAPQLQCAGKPSRSKLQPSLDLALIKCDTDLDGRSWNPLTSGIWATLPEAAQGDVTIGERLWVLGYPDRGGGGLTLTEGQVEGWTGPDGTSGRDYISTRASISSGSSGGPVVDDHGRLVGIASAFRANGKVGLVRPLQAASQLLAYATAGWTPLENHTEVSLTPTSVEAAAEGTRIYTTVIDDATETPLRDALVMVLRPGVSTSSIDLNRLDDQAIAWGRTNAQGEVRLKQLVPAGTYTVMVMAQGYEALIGDSELHLDANTPPSFDPWGKIGLHSR
ncbi:MAG: trypsin-like peptidase domain-containing protein [Deltaproteobacteria bacterium]